MSLADGFALPARGEAASRILLRVSRQKYVLVPSHLQRAPGAQVAEAAPGWIGRIAPDLLDQARVKPTGRERAERPQAPLHRGGERIVAEAGIQYEQQVGIVPGRSDRRRGREPLGKGGIAGQQQRGRAVGKERVHNPARQRRVSGLGQHKQRAPPARQAALPGLDPPGDVGVARRPDAGLPLGLAQHGQREDAGEVEPERAGLEQLGACLDHSPGHRGPHPAVCRVERDDVHSGVGLGCEECTRGPGNG